MALLSGAVMSVSALTACGGADPGASGTKSGADVITFRSFVKASDVVTAAFNKTHKDFQVKWENVPSGTDYYTKLASSVKAGNVPDVAVVEYNQLPDVVSQGGLEDLTETAGQVVTGNFPPQVQQLVTLGGKTWGVPRDVAPLVLFYRKDFYDKHDLEPAKTWDEYTKLLEKVKKADSKARGGIFATADANLLAALAWQAGGHWYGTEGQSWKVSIDDEPSKKMAAYWTDLVSKGLVGSYNSTSDDAFFQAVQKGEVVSYICANWCAGALQSTVPDQKGKWAVAMVPSWDGRPASAMFGGSSFTVPKGAKHPEQALEFIKWITTDPEGMKAWLSSGTSSMLPAAPALLSTTSAFKTDFYDGQDIFALASKSYESVPSGWMWGPSAGVTGTAISDSLGKVAGGEMTLADVLTSAQQATVADFKGRGLSVVQ
ncbi:sugar ABC transporter substrate-binding protein [Nonomuraea maheshkhaliensis]|uniref:Sugar ABC transporter substrate-binding protein n=2 Tax=Nonomuraea maheshkhaliensis TaxID=419590 RepID=A0ABP4SPN2_9ACTN